MTDKVPLIETGKNGASDVNHSALPLQPNTYNSLASSPSPSAPVPLSGSGPVSLGSPNNPAFAGGVGGFTAVLGTLPFREPNVRPGTEQEDLSAIFNVGETPGFLKNLCVCLCSLTGIGALYMCSKGGLVKEGEYGLTLNSGKYEILFPGWFVLASPLNSLQGTYDIGQNVIDKGPVKIIRILSGQLGFATNNGQPEILLPGVHARNSTAFKYEFAQTIGEDLIVCGPIKILTVKSGGVRICYNRGKVEILSEGRYAINDGTFVVQNYINTQQQNLRFDKHPVLLDGGIQMLVEGLLTFQVIDVGRLIKELGSNDLNRAIQDITKAEISRVFSSVHLEQISSASAVASKAEFQGKTKEEISALLGEDESPEGQYRSRLCQQVIEYITPITEQWGVKIINFQLESTKIADAAYARDYEIASLGMAKARASLRAVEAENEILLQKSKAAAQAVQIEAEGKGAAVVIGANASAESRKIEAIARNNAALKMKNNFAKQYAMSGTQVEWAAGLNAKSITVLPNPQANGANVQPLLIPIQQSNSQ